MSRAVWRSDNDQRLTEHVLQENPDTQAVDERNWTFGYDTLDQLAGVTDNGVTLYSYPYNAIGNRTDAGSVSMMNQYASFRYNGRGDVTDDGTYSYTWDAKDRLVAAEPDSPSAQSQKDVFTYDPENRRTQEDIYSWDTNTQAWVYASSLKFVYNGSQMVAELDGQNHLLQSYAWGPTGTLLSITDYSSGTPTNYQVATDGSGSVVELLDSSSGIVAASYEYDPWGNPTSATGPAAGVSPFRWQGEFYDASFGGYYMGAREGSARLHIFLSPDPSGEGSDPNLYRMVGNDPINKTDPNGLMWSQFLQYINDEGAKHFDPWLVKTVGNIFGPNAAEATAEVAAWNRGFADDFVERTDIVRQLGNVVEHPVVSFQTAGNAIDTKFAEVKQAYNETGSIPIALGEFGPNLIVGGIENAYVVGPPRAVGNGWARFNAIGNGTVGTLNSITVVGGGATGTIGFVRNVALGMQEARLAVNLSTSVSAPVSAPRTTVVGGRTFAVERSPGGVIRLVDAESGSYISGQMAGRSLSNIDVKVAESLQRQGLSKQLYQRLVSEAGDINSISGELTQFNLQRLMELEAELPSTAAAARLTPAARARAGAGFTVHSYDEATGVLTSTRPPAR